MKTAVILANGGPPPAEVLREALAGADLFVCADGGANAARSMGFTPHAIVGDMDSISAETSAAFQDVPRRVDCDTERSDLEKSLDFALERGPWDEIRILGASSGRLDHVLGHLSVLRRFEHRARLVLQDQHGRAFLGRGQVALAAPVGTVVSFFAVGAPAEGVTTRGLRYPLENRRLELGVQDSVSNVVSETPAWISIRSGELIVILVHHP